MALKLGPISRMRMTIEPWHYAQPGTPGPTSITLRTKIEIGNHPPFHFQEAMRESDFESRFDYILEHIGRRMHAVYKAAKAGELEVQEDGTLKIKGKELGQW